jgi:acetyl-CoA acetyltransferase family protein
VNPRMRERYGTDTMPETAQNVADEYGISRADQDAFALRSQQRASAAITRGRFNREITAVPVPQRRGEPVVVDRDEHPRETSAAALAALRAVVPGGSITAGNSSGINDGAAALLIASGDAVRRYGLTPLARIGAVTAAGVPPRTMGIGPVPAVEKLLARTGLGIGEIDVLELNEALAAQALAVLRGLGLPDDAEHVNPHGGAIALGHPLAASGVRLMIQLAAQFAERPDVRYGLTAMCVGLGQGGSVIWENPHFDGKNRK